MPSRTGIGLVVALVLMTVAGFLAGQTDSQPDKADPDGDRLDRAKLRMLSETVKLNWCEENAGRCPMGNFPTEGPEADLARNLIAIYDTLFPSSINALHGNEGVWPPAPEPPGPDFVLDVDRCCPTNSSFMAMVGKKRNYLNQVCIFPPFKNWPTQIVAIGSCSGSSQTGCSQVDGACTQATRFVKLLCRLETINRVYYTWFQVDAYCSCRYIAPP